MINIGVINISSKNCSESSNNSIFFSGNAGSSTVANSFKRVSLIFTNKNSYFLSLYHFELIKIELNYTPLTVLVTFGSFA